MNRPILEIDHVTKTFRERGGMRFKAVDDISMVVKENECVGIVGESGCGKSTLARIITRLILPDAGTVRFCGTDLTKAKGASLRAAYKDMKMIFQEPRSSFDPRLTLGESIGDTLKPVIEKKAERTQRVYELLQTVGLDRSFANAYPWQVSGGECQRAAIARATARNPKLLICDEATSALDVSVQAQVIDLLGKIRRETGISYLFISHDLALVSSFCNRTYVLYGGKVVEEGETGRIIAHPENPYTQKLIACVLTV